ncbi:hypothetical protein C9374_006210 [Naegleria lovaniensis]|uniref:COP9 signalosome complex subunit 5 n=1 Tax=Naegleria lovaniensis TaxID=51637 RepID=A0AA88GIW1_NAELO|nr:uncharacterized protein C9374_006210 [Naegleria lovaniensis]KAG2381826.1 hypothetical protein C9374_006210 [Naegleria lovaniensis]
MLSGKDAQKQWEAENKIKELTDEQLYKYDEEKEQKIRQERPWERDPKYFKKVKISALALLKMAMHTTKGQPLEVMGLMQGKIEGDCFIVMDAFALPVEGTETRVNAGNEAIEYMGRYMDLSQLVGRSENVVGWYHSHPGYGYPFVAIVVDPVRTVSAGRVEIGAFRTYPEGYSPGASSSSEYQSIPMDKIEDYGVYHDKYYQLEIEFFKSSTDTKLLNVLWNKYWINILSSSAAIKNRNYTNDSINDIARKMDKAEHEIGRGGKMSGFMMEGKESKKKEETQLDKLTKDSIKLSTEVLQGIISQAVKDSLFNKH